MLTEQNTAGEFLDLVSLGHAAAEFQRTPQEIQFALKRLGYRCAVALNDVGYWRHEEVSHAMRAMGSQAWKEYAEREANFKELLAVPSQATAVNAEA